jgi:hypothetical protein
MLNLTNELFVIPGTQGHPAYKNYLFHFRGFLIGTVFSALGALVFAGVAYIL